MTTNEFRKYVRKIITEEVNNFLDKEKGTATKQLKDTSKSQNLGDPISDVKMNQMANELGSDGENAPTVSVTAGAQKGGHGPDVGQRQANFKDKTALAK